ncbi:hypothetical protein AG1IA_03047 [Rhizoctonia solani AG-1 IA]|uniref:Secreted protein n=1 Tax=Thanatephorus cucumeris (strain AG1-IA) TaxID=983506 RepID=L8X1P1_THACA|nr:hypothetical protein AG1IA_03047 [Rhizoctonia solani AG-1 IA]
MNPVSISYLLLFIISTPPSSRQGVKITLGPFPRRPALTREHTTQALHFEYLPQPHIACIIPIPPLQSR